MDHKGASELLGVYVLDACEENEAAAVAGHVATCELCAREVAVLGELAGWLGASEATSPSPALRSRVLDEADKKKDTDER